MGTTANLAIPYPELTDTPDVPRDMAALANRVDAIASALGIGVGEVRWYAGSDSPAGWIECDGRAIARATYPALHAKIGTAYGPGDGATTFNVPDFRGRAPVGAGTGTGGAAAGAAGSAPAAGAALAAKARGQWGGREAHVLTVAELAAHVHQGALASGPGGSTASGLVPPSNAAVSAAWAVESTGSNGAHPNDPPWLALRAMIRALPV